jgi:mevalonate pyrophosphate decarboxylase
MKYLITENQKENTLKKFIMSNFDRVDNVWFKTRSVYYGTDTGEETVIMVLVDNLDDELTKQDLFELKKNIIEKTDKVFNLGYFKHRGGWGFGFRKKVIESF